MDRKRFEKLVLNAWESIPCEFRDRIDNVEITVQDRPTKDQRIELGLDSNSLLLGLYSGTPLHLRSVWEGIRFPDEIILFQKNIEAVCSSDSEIEERVNEVLIHEIAHYFGMSDEEIYAIMGRD